MNFRRSAGISAKEKVMAEERFDNESLDEFPLLMSPTAKIPASPKGTFIKPKKKSFTPFSNDHVSPFPKIEDLSTTIHENKTSNVILENGINESAGNFSKPSNVPNPAPPFPSVIRNSYCLNCCPSIHLYKFDECPPYLQDNCFVRTGYRVNLSFISCLKSLCQLHNETLNIWTHLLGTLLFFILMVWTLTNLPDLESIDRTVFSAFFVGAQCQMLFSTLFHMFCCHSPEIYMWFAKLDYSGITLMIVGSYYPPLYYGFSCSPQWRIVYMVFITLFGVVGICVSCIPIFSTSAYRLVRTGFFLAFGFFAIFPIPHMIYLVGWDLISPIFLRELLMGSLYVMGVFIYGSRIPERFFPGKFDYFVSQLFPENILCLSFNVLYLPFFLCLLNL